jgi:hypothetical protein
MKRCSPALLLLLVLLGALAVSQAATAASPSRPNPTFAHPTPRDTVAEFEEEELAEEDEFEFEECDVSSAEEVEFAEAEEEFEEEESEAPCGGGSEAAKVSKGAPFVTAPVACQVRKAESTITALPGSDQVRLSVRYQTYAPTEVTVGLKLKDRKGSIAIEHSTKHMSVKGVLHITTELGTAVMERALTATEFDVSLRAPETPGFCADALEQSLHSVKHTGGRAPRVYSD